MSQPVKTFQKFSGMNDDDSNDLLGIGDANLGTIEVSVDNDQEAEVDNLDDVEIDSDDLNCNVADTAAAIESIVAQLDDDDLQDDVDLGLDIIEDLSEGEPESSSRPDSRIEDEAQTRDIQSPHDIEIDGGPQPRLSSPVFEDEEDDYDQGQQYEQHQPQQEQEQHQPQQEQEQEEHQQQQSDQRSVLKPSMLFGRRVPVLQLARLRLSNNCISEDDRVDLKVFRKSCPGLFPKSNRGRPPGTKTSVTSFKDHEKKKISKPGPASKKSSSKSGPASKAQITPPKKKTTSAASVSSSKQQSKAILSSDSDSDSDLEELRRKIMKPAVIVSADKAVENLKKNTELAKKPPKKQDHPPMVKSVKSAVAAAVVPKIPTGGLIVKPCRVKLDRLSKTKIERWTCRKQRRLSSVSSSRGRSKSPANSSRSRSRSRSRPPRKRTISATSSRGSAAAGRRKKSKVSVSDSSSDEEEEKTKKGQQQQMVRNPLFLLASSASSKGEENIENHDHDDEEVKKVLVEKLFNLLNSNGENNKTNDDDDLVKEKAVEKVKIIPEKAANVVVVVEESTTTKQSEKPLKELFADSKESVDIRSIAELKPFADLLRMEIGNGSLAFLGQYRVNLRELESIVHKVIAKLDVPKPLEKPSLPQPSGYQKAKYKIKNVEVKLRDIRHKKAFAKAQAAYKADSAFRVRRRKNKLLKYLKHIGEKRKEQNSSIKRKTVVSSDDDDEDNVRPTTKVKYDDLNQFGSFK
jgi:hypothetical protein